MPHYTFRTPAYVTIEANNEEEARSELIDCAAAQQLDVDYNGLMVYIDPYPDQDPDLVDTYEEDDD
jgi:hypothetical protein